MDTEKLIVALKWRESVAKGRIEEIVSMSPYTLRRDYMGYSNVSQKTLDDICAVANGWWKRQGSNLRIVNSMGELIPATKK